MTVERVRISVGFDGKEISRQHLENKEISDDEWDNMTCMLYTGKTKTEVVQELIELYQKKNTS